jgi:hypothetical protein
MEKEPKNYQEMWMAIAFVISAWFYIYSSNQNKRIIISIKNHTIDTLYANDTLYILKVKIDTSYYQEKAYDISDKPSN